MKETTWRLLTIKGQAIRETVNVLTPGQKKLIKSEMRKPGAPADLGELIEHTFKVVVGSYCVYKHSTPTEPAGCLVAAWAALCKLRNLRMMLNSIAEDRNAGAVPAAKHAASVFVTAASVALRIGPEVAKHWPTFAAKVSIHIQPPTPWNDHRNHSL